MWWHFRGHVVSSQGELVGSFLEFPISRHWIWLLQSSLWWPQTCFSPCDRIPLRWAQPCRSSTTWESWEKPSAAWWGVTGAPSRTTSAKLWTSRDWLSLPTPKVTAAERKCEEGVVIPHKVLTFFLDFFFLTEVQLYNAGVTKFTLSINWNSSLPVL